MRWTDLLERARPLAPHGRDPQRLANLVLAAQIAALQGRTSFRQRRFRDRPDGLWLADAVQRLALQPLHLAEGSVRQWDALATSARPLAAALHLASGRAGGMDGWIEAFQGVDAARKSRGAYATPRSLAAPMAQLLLRGGPAPQRAVDPSAGAGSLLIAVLDQLRRATSNPGELRQHTYRLHGVELDAVARELCCLLIWLASYGSGARLGAIARRVQVGNAITADWWKQDPYDALIMNPPWDSLRDTAGQSAQDPQSDTGGKAAQGAGAQGASARDAGAQGASARDAGAQGASARDAGAQGASARGASARDAAQDTGELQREATVARLTREAAGARDLPPLFTAQGRGDRNLYKAFAELAPHLLQAGGRLVALLPGAWSSDLGTRRLRTRYLQQLNIEQWTSFENLRGWFPIDSRYKFGIVVATRDAGGTQALRTRGFAAAAEDLERKHVVVQTSALRQIGGAAAIIPDLTCKADWTLLQRARRHGTPLFDPKGALGRVSYRREVDLTEDRKRGLFQRFEHLQATPCGAGRWRTPEGREMVPLLEGRMVGAYDFHQKTWVAGAGRTAAWTYANGHRLQDCRPQFLIEPDEDERLHRIAVCDVTSATNTRTVLATWVPPRWRCGNTAPVLAFESERQSLAALAVLNSMVFDWFARRLIAGLHLNRFYLEALSWPALNEARVDELATAGSALVRLSPRFRDFRRSAIKTAPARLDYLDAHVLIERTVAVGYHLSASDLSRIFAASTADRRGFWRHFGSDPHARPIAQATLEGTRRSRRPARPAAGVPLPAHSV